MELTPAVYEHAAALIGRTPWEASRDPEWMFAGHAEAFRLYHHCPIVGIDIYNLEAEALGAEVRQPGGTGIPAVSEHICGCVEEMADLTPLDASAGRIPMVIEVARRLACEFPHADVRVPVSGPYSIACSLLGLETLVIETAMKPDATAKALQHIAAGQLVFCQAVRDAGLGIALFESAATPPMLSPAMFRDVELPVLKWLLGQASDIVSHSVPCIIGGDTAPILEDILSTGTGYVICPGPDETDQKAFLQTIRNRTDVRVRVNMNAAIIASGSELQVQQEIDRIVELIDGRENACIGTGVLPYETPRGSVLRAIEYAEGK